MTVGPAPPRPQQRRGHEVHGGLAPSRALHDQRPPPLHDQGVDRGPLVVAQARPGPREGAQHLFGTVAESGVGQLGRRHPSIVTPTPDNSAFGHGYAHDL